MLAKFIGLISIELSSASRVTFSVFFTFPELSLCEKSAKEKGCYDQDYPRSWAIPKNGIKPKAAHSK